jgi:hypothetical protein
VPDSGFDPSVAHPARIYDYWLGGKGNYEADRRAGEQVLRSLPVLVAGARANRAFLGRAVRFLANETRIEQFLDIGSGLPTAANTHEVAQAIAPGVAAGRRDFNRLSSVPMTSRSGAQVARLFEGMTLVEPGLAQPQQWRLPHDPEPGTPIPAWCGIAVKP